MARQHTDPRRPWHASEPGERQRLRQRGEDMPQDVRDENRYGGYDDRGDSRPMRTDERGNVRGDMYGRAPGEQGPRQPDWDEDIYGYPEATSYRREMSRSRDDYRPESRFANDPGEQFSPDRYRRGQGFDASSRGQFSLGGVIDESDYQRWGSDPTRTSGGGYGMPGGYGAMGDYGAEGLWRGTASGGGFGGSRSPFSARPGRFARKGPKGYTRSDDRIREDVCERLYHADDVDVGNVTVQVEGGTVHLEGTVPERWMKYRIEDICDDALGVADIDNRIRITRVDPSMQAGGGEPAGERGRQH